MVAEAMCWVGGWLEKVELRLSQLSTKIEVEVDLKLSLAKKTYIIPTTKILHFYGKNRLLYVFMKINEKDRHYKLGSIRVKLQFLSGQSSLRGLINLNEF